MAAVAVLVLERSDVIRSGLRLILSQQAWVARCVAAGGVEEAVRLAGRYEPHVAVVDAEAGGAPPAVVCGRLRAARPALTVLLAFAGTPAPRAVARAVGACGCVGKAWPAARIAATVQAAAAGRAEWAAPAGEKLSRALGGAGEAAPHRLSPREREVLGLVACGATNREIAGALRISPNTVKDHTRAVYRKLEVRNRTEAVQHAQRAGLIV